MKLMTKLRLYTAIGLQAAHGAAFTASQEIVDRIVVKLMPSRDELYRGTKWEGTPEPDNWFPY